MAAQRSECMKVMRNKVRPALSCKLCHSPLLSPLPIATTEPRVEHKGPSATSGVQEGASKLTT